MQLNQLDWIIIGAYGLFSLIVGLYYTKRAGESVDEFFIGGRKITWFIAGTSLVATTFASDTPLVVSGLIRNGGIYENWLWWSGIMGSVLTVFFFAKLWRRARILTDIEFNEIRYVGKAASVLRGFNAVYGGLLANSIVLGWVILAMTKICDVLLGWPKVTSVGILLAATLVYSVLSGYWGAVMTDVVQFFIAMGGAVMLAVIAVWKLGGPTNMVHHIMASPGYDPKVFQMVPTLAIAGKLAFITFVIQISIQWWNGAAGGGYIAQRFFSTKTEKDAVLAGLWFTFANFILRSWPWILVGLASIAFFPITKGEDHEIFYPRMIVRFLPPGLRGLMAASLFAAFMSTVTTQLNYGASYVINDLYRRFMVKGKSDKHYVNASRVATLVIMGLGAIAAWQSNNISHVWIYLATLGAGGAFLGVLRWYWWRVNPWSEISALVSSLIFANGNIICRPLAYFGWISSSMMSKVEWFYGADTYAIRLAVIVVICTIVWVAVTYMTAPVPHEHLVAFYRRVRPGGWWGEVAKSCPDVVPDSMTKAVIGWFLGVAATFTGMFGIGFLFLGRVLQGSIILAVGALLIWLTVSQVSGDEIEEEPIPEMESAGEVLESGN